MKKIIKEKNKETGKKEEIPEDIQKDWLTD